jgi:putative MATE family efflux protein
MPESLFEKGSRKMSEAAKIDTDRSMRFFAFAAPISAQNLIGISLLIIDMAMISRLGVTAVAAIGVIRGLFFFFQVIADSICQYAGAAIARYLGANNWPEIWRTATTTLCLNVAIASPIFLACVLFSDEVAALLVGQSDPGVQESVAAYLSITAPFFILIAVVLALSALLRSTGHPRLPLYAAVMALSLNTSLNYLLIFGVAGFEGLGLTGAAIATVISRVVEIVILAICIWKALKPSWIQLKFRRTTMVSILSGAYPVFLKSVIWSSGMLLYGLIFLRADPTGYPNYAVLLAFDSLLFAVVYGFVVTIKIFIGNEIGASGIATVSESAWSYLKLTFCAVGLVGVFALLAIPVFAQIFAIVDAELMTFTVIFVAIVLRALARSITASIMDGVMRAGDDNLHAALIEFIANYLVNLPILLTAYLLFGLPIEFLVFIALTDEVVRLVMALRRMRSKVWLSSFNEHAIKE